MTGRVLGDALVAEGASREQFEDHLSKLLYDDLFLEILYANVQMVGIIRHTSTGFCLVNQEDVRGEIIRRRPELSGDRRYPGDGDEPAQRRSASS